MRTSAAAPKLRNKLGEKSGVKKSPAEDASAAKKSGGPGKGGPESKEQVYKLASAGELVMAWTLVLALVAVFILGRQYWDERYYIPDEGLGYYLGLVGGVFMLLGFAYTAFKYVPAFRTRSVM